MLIDCNLDSHKWILLYSYQLLHLLQALLPTIHDNSGGPGSPESSYLDRPLPGYPHDVDLRSPMLEYVPIHCYR